MTFALIVSTFLIGASPVDSGGGSSLLSPDIAPPTSGLPLPPIQENASAQQKTKSRGSSPLERTMQQHNAQREQYGYSGSSENTRNQTMRRMMPTAPTESAGGGQGGQAYQYLPPTANQAAAESSAGYGRLGGMSHEPSAPTRARPGTSQSYASMQEAQTQNRRMQAAKNATAAPPQTTTTAFSGVNQSSSSGVSPYMNLFRTGNSNGTIDNYSTLVRPELDQRRANQKFGADIHGLENSTHVQSLNIQQLNRDAQMLQGVNATQYFMNYGDYYPGAR
jgi:hypothetical protein